MIRIYSTYQTERLRYVLDFCFLQKGVPYEIIQRKDQWEKRPEKTINYSHEALEAELTIKPQGILFETEIYPSKIIESTKDKLMLDGVPDQFGLILYFLTSYCEYFNQERDAHERYPSKLHPLVRLGFNHIPVVDQLVKEIWDTVGLDYERVKNQFQLIPTFDIDIAWAYKQRSLLRTIGGAIKGGKPFERIQVLAGSKKDPYDTFDAILEIGKHYRSTRCFILLGDYGKYDKNIHWENKAYQDLINSLNDAVNLGIHPSYGAFENMDQVRTEKNRLREIINEEITASRQHFLRLKIPDTYHTLIAAGIQEDYSMGFADNIGFRAGTSFPYPFFDLKTNQKTTLMIHPFVYMDSAIKDYLNWDIETGIEEIQSLKEKVAEVGGQFIFIWHNSSIHNSGEWKGWSALLDQTLNTENGS